MNICDPHVKIKQIRELKNLTQEYIASQLAISIRAYSKIESGETQLTINRLNEISKILNVEPMDILGFEAGNVFNNCTQEGNIGINYIQMSEKLIVKYEQTIEVLESQITLLQDLLKGYLK